MQERKRRQPWTSVFPKTLSTLDKRLSNDIVDLDECFSTKVVTSLSRTQSFYLGVALNHTQSPCHTQALSILICRMPSPLHSAIASYASYQGMMLYLLKVHCVTFPS